MAYLSLAAVLSEMNQAEAESRSMLDLGTITPSPAAKKPAPQLEESPTMAQPPVVAKGIQDLIQQMLGGRAPQ